VQGRLCAVLMEWLVDVSTSGKRHPRRVPRLPTLVGKSACIQAVLGHPFRGSSPSWT
jgi:hypothetical protein